MAFLSQQEVEQIVRKYFPVIAEVINSSFREYLDVRTERSRYGVVDLKPRTCGSLINDFIKLRLAKAFAGNSEVVVGEFKGIVGILIRGEVFIRFKKLDDELKGSNAQTLQTEKYYKQIDFAGFGVEPTLLVAGFLPDSSWTQLIKIVLVCREGDTVVWFKDLTTEVKQSAIFEVAKINNVPAAESVPRVRAKKQDGKTGTDNK